MVIKTLGGADRIGKSCIYVGTGREGVLLDVGLSVKDGSMVSVPDSLKGKVKGIIITHAHLDHIGSLPWIWHRLGRPPIYMTPITADIADIVLKDAQKVAVRKTGDLLVEEQIMDDCSSNYHRNTFAFEARVEVTERISFVLHKAGHIPGAAYVELDVGGEKLIYTGDIADFKQRVVDRCYLPPKAAECDVLIMESTYGDKTRITTRSIEIAGLVDTVAATLENGGRVLIPAFAIGRAQEVILILLTRILSGQLPKVHIYIDGLVREVCDLLEEKGVDGRDAPVWAAENKLFYRQGIVKPVRDDEERAKVAFRKEPCIIVSSSGMLTAGPAAMYASVIADEPESAILLVGYQDEEAPGHTLLETGRLILNGEQVEVKCRVAKYGLSAHAHAGGLVRFAAMWQPHRVILVHPGAPGSREHLAVTLNRILGVQVACPKDGEEVSEGTYRRWHIPTAPVTDAQTRTAKGIIKDGKLIVDVSDLPAVMDGNIRIVVPTTGGKAEITVEVQNIRNVQAQKAVAAGGSSSTTVVESVAETPVRTKTETLSERKRQKRTIQKTEKKTDEKTRKETIKQTTEDRYYTRGGGRIGKKVFQKIPPEILKEVFSIKPGDKAYRFVEENKRILELKHRGLTSLRMSEELNIPASTIRDRLRMMKQRGIEKPEDLPDNALELFALFSTPVVADDMAQRVKKLKEMGFNVIWNHKKRILDIE